MTTTLDRFRWQGGDVVYLPAAKLAKRSLGKANDNTPKRIANTANLAPLATAADQTASDLTIVAEEGGRAAIIGLGYNDQSLFGVVNERAVAWADARAAELVTEIDDATRSEIQSLVAQGLDDGLSVDEIAQTIEDATAFSPDRADLIAENEVATANSQGALDGFQTVQDEEGVQLKKEWLLGEGACDICQENADAGPIDLDDVFPSGDDAPTAHPRCRCALGSVVEGQSE